MALRPVFIFIKFCKYYICKIAKNIFTIFILLSILNEKIGHDKLKVIDREVKIMKIKNVSFGITNKQTSKQVGTDKSMAQNTLLPVSLSKKNSSYKLSTDIVNLNTTNAISFGSIGDWKKWRDKNPLYASLFDLQKYTALNGGFAIIQPSISILANNIMLFCGCMKDKFCNNYKNKEAKEKLKVPPTVPITITTILSAAEIASTKDAIKTAVTSTAASGFNIAVGAISGIITKLSEDAAARSALTVFIMEAYGGAVIYYLENRRDNKDDGSGGNNINGRSLGIVPEYYGNITPESVEKFFQDLDMEKLKKFHKYYENYMLLYFPQNMDIKETYSLEVDKKTNKLYVYDKIDNEIMCSINNIPLKIETPKQTIQESTHTQTYSKPSYSHRQYNYNSNRYNRNDGLIGGMLC